MVDEHRTIQVRRTVRRVRNNWYRAGVPRRVRRDKAEELRAHLLEALDDGRRIEDVVGDDLAAFASEWAQAERPRPLLDVALQLLAILTLIPGGLALLNPWLSALVGQQDPRTGVPVDDLTFLAVITPVINSSGCCATASPPSRPLSWACCCSSGAWWWPRSWRHG